MTATLLDTLATRLHAIERGGRYHADCPWCGKCVKQGQVHFIIDGRGAHCFACGRGASLLTLARELTVNPDGLSHEAPERRERPRAPFEMSWREWQAATAPHVDEALARWQQYKPVSREVITRYGLTVGRVPVFDEKRWEWRVIKRGAQYITRLIVPVLGDGRVVGIAARAIEATDDAPKWLTPGSKQYLQGAGQVRRGSRVVVVENYFDRIALAVARPDVVPVATGGLFWRPEWTAHLKAQRPSEVLIWFDHDLSGNGSAHHADRWLAEWQAQIDARWIAERRFGIVKPKPPEPFGPRLANDLAAAGLPVRVFAWPCEAKHKADVGDVLANTWRA